MKVMLHIDSVDGTFGVDLGWVSSGILTLEHFKQIHVDIVQSDLPRDLPYDTPVLWDMDSHEVIVADKPDPYCLKCEGRGVGDLARWGHCPKCYSINLAKMMAEASVEELSWMLHRRGKYNAGNWVFEARYEIKRRLAERPEATIKGPVKIVYLEGDVIKWDALSPVQEFTGTFLFYNKGYWD